MGRSSIVLALTNDLELTQGFVVFTPIGDELRPPVHFFDVISEPATPINGWSASFSTSR